MRAMGISTDHQGPTTEQMALLCGAVDHLLYCSANVDSVERAREEVLNY